MQLSLRCCPPGLAAQPKRQRRTADCQPAAACFNRTVGNLPLKLLSSTQHQLQQQHKAAQLRALLPAGAEHLLTDSTAPILKIVMCCCVGAVCAKHGMIDLQTRRALSHLAINVFTPALMITKLGGHIDVHQALALWPIGANVLTCHLVGLAVGILHTKVLPTPASLTNIIRVSTAISNVGNLPLVMVMSLVKNPNLPFNTASEAELAVSYVMLGWFYATMIQMPLGHWLLHKDEHASRHRTATVAALVQQSAHTAAAAAIVPAPAAATSFITHPATAAAPVIDIASNIVPLSQVAATAGAASRLDVTNRVSALLTAPSMTTSSSIAACIPQPTTVTSTTAAQPTAASLYKSLPHSVAHSKQAWPMERQVTHVVEATRVTSESINGRSNAGTRGDGGKSSHSDSHAAHRCSDNTSSNNTTSLSEMLASGVLRQQQLSWWEWQFAEKVKGLACDIHPFMKGIVSAPLIAGLAAIGIGSCPPLRDALFSPGGTLSVIGDCLDMLGQPLIPVLLLVLGANLAAGPGPGNLPSHSALGVVATRLVLLPVLGCAAVLAAQRTGLISMQDPLTLVVMMVAWSTPTAILVHSLASVHHNGENEVSALLFWEYLACIITLPLCSATYLYLIGCCMSYAA